MSDEEKTALGAGSAAMDEVQDPGPEAAPEAGAPDSADSSSDGKPADAAEAASSGEDAWWADLPEDRHELLKQYDSAREALDGLLKHEGQKITVPGEDATDEERDAFRKALGVPEAADGYETPELAETPDGLDLDDEVGKAFRAKAHELGLTPEQYQGVIAWAVPAATENARGAEHEMRRFQSDEVGKLVKTHGREQAGRMLDAARDAAMAIGGEELIEALGKSGSDSRVLEAFARIRPLVAEGSLRNGAPADGQLTREQLREMQRDPRYADPQRRDPEFVKRIEAGYQALADSK